MTTVATAARVRLDGTDVEFVMDGHVTILSAALAAGVDLPYECASGGCGTCKVRLRSGDVRALWPDATGLSRRDRDKGDRVLACQSVPVGDCVIAAPVAGADVASSAEGVPALRRTGGNVVELLDLTPTTRLVRIDTDVAVDFRAGQFVMLELPDGTRRAYSMAHLPSGGCSLRFVVRAKPGGRASAWLFERLAVGDPLVVEGPYGRAYFQSPRERPVVAIAGGSGLGPMVAIVAEALTESPGRPVHLYVGSRREEDEFFADELATLTQGGAAVTRVVEEGAPGARDGLVSDAVTADHPDLTGADVYLCGPPGMVDACLALLVRTGVAKADRVFFDRFQ